MLAVEFQLNVWVGRRFAELQFWAQEFCEHHQEGSHQKSIGKINESVIIQAGKRNDPRPQGHQRKNEARILSFQPGRAMGTNQLPPALHVQKKRRRAILRAMGAHRHGGHPFPVLPLLSRGYSHAVNGTKGYMRTAATPARHPHTGQEGILTERRRLSLGAGPRPASPPRTGMCARKSRNNYRFCATSA